MNTKKPVTVPIKFSLKAIDNHKFKKKKKKSKRKTKGILPFPPRVCLVNNKLKKKKKNKGTIISNPPIYSSSICSSSSSSDNGGYLDLDEDALIYEILTRLRVKSLIRLSSVCKRWDSIIHKDHDFAISHLRRSKLQNPSLFIIAQSPPMPRASGRFDETHDYFLLRADFVENGKGALIHSVNHLSSNCIRGATQPVNGLTCFIHTSHDAVQFYNITTQEKSPWIVSKFLMGERKAHKEKCSSAILDQRKPFYQLGFDPASNVHKLVCVRRLYRSDIDLKYNVCEVLTLPQIGDDNNLKGWRRINDVPPVPMLNPSVYVNGSIYWINPALNRGGKWKGKIYDPVFIVAFDVGNETFRVIPVPRFVFDNHRYLQGHLLVDLLALNGSIALQMIHCGIARIYIFDHDKKDNIATTISNQNWTEMAIKLPPSFCDDGLPDLKSVFNQIIITAHCIRSEDKEFISNGFEVNTKSLPFCSYKLTKNIFEEFEVSGVPAPISDGYTIWAFNTFTESLFPVCFKLDSASFGNPDLVIRYEPW